MSDDLAKHNDLDAVRPASGLGEDELKREQLRLTVEKMRFENRKLERDLTPESWWFRAPKEFLAWGGIFTILLTVYGLVSSYNKASDDRANAQAAERRVRFEDAVKRLESPNVTSKLVAVAVLSGYLTDKDRPYHRQILLTFASVVATESDLLMQAAIFDLMKAQDNKAIVEADWSYFQGMLVSQSRALVARKDLYRSRQFGLDTRTASADEVAARHVGRLIAQNAQDGRVSKFDNYAGVYCEACDFRYKKFPRGADFSNAILDRADFRGATLEGANFNNAEMEGTVFAQAYLKDAQFQTVPESRLNEGVGATTDDVATIELKTPYLQHVLQLLDSQVGVNVTMPNFSCTYLQGARFDNLSLFGIAGRTFRKLASGDEKRTSAEGSVVERLPLTATPPSFYRADLKDAKLGSIRAFSLRVSEDAMPMNYLVKPTTSEKSGLVLWEGPIQEKSLIPPPEANAAPKPAAPSDPTMDTEDKLRQNRAEQMNFQHRLRYSFGEAEVSSAILPDGMTQLLNKEDSRVPKPLAADPRAYERRYKPGFLYVYPISGQWDFDCRKRTSPSGEELNPNR
jgi:hypothetical protein